MQPGRNKLAPPRGQVDKAYEPALLLMRARVLHQAGKLDEARSCYKKVLKKAPDNFQALHFYGLCEHQSGNLDIAIRHLKRALLIEPNSAQAHSDMSGLMMSAGRPLDALAACDKAIALDPNLALAHSNRGLTLLALGRYEEAVASLDRAIELDPTRADSWSDRGNALHRLGRYDDALDSYARAIEVDPLHDVSFINRATLFKELKRFDEALASYDRALSIGKRLLEAAAGRTELLLHGKRVHEALQTCTALLKIEPESPQALTLLGNCMAALGDADTATALYTRALAVNPKYESAISSKIFAMDFSSDANFESQQATRWDWWDNVGIDIYKAYAAPLDNDRDPDRRLVIGYVSADFRHHSAAFSFRPVLENHDKRQFEIICYSGVVIPDPATAGFQAVADKWRDASQWTDDRLAETIRADKVDVLVDLSGHTAGNRLRVFARKVAPVQITAWGHSTGTGLPTMDYLFADPITIPKEARHLFAETVYDLPVNIIIEPPPIQGGGFELPSDRNGYLTYGSLNRVSKMSDAAIAVWSRIMTSNPTSRLVLKDHGIDDPAVRQTLLEKFAGHGVKADRISLLGPSPRHEHLQTLRGIDLCLDPFPQPGGVSSWEALYMGVPPVTKLGNTINSRLGGSILAAAGIPDFIARDEDDYVRIAANPDLERLRSIRNGLPNFIYERYSPSVYTRAVEEAYRTIWKNYCATPSPNPRDILKRRFSPTPSR